MDDSIAVTELENSYEEEPQVEKSKGFNVGEIIEGKREKKKVERLVQSVQLGKPKERLKIESGDGDKLGEIARINHNIGKMKAPLLKPLHKILFDRPGAAASMKKNLRLFSGFPFKEDSDPYSKKMKMLSKYTNTMLKTICQVLDIERSGKQSVLIERIMAFLMHPVNTGKPVPVKKKKKKKRKNTAADGGQKTSKVSKSPKKAKVEGKSKAIVTDSSSDDDDDDDNEDGKAASRETKSSSAPESRKKDTDDSSDEDEEEVDHDDDDDDDDDDDEEEEAPKSKSPAKKKPAVSKKTTASKKTAKPTPARKKPASKKTAKEEESDASDKSDSDESDNQDGSDFEKSIKKPAAKKKQVKPAPKTKKADSSSHKAAKKRQVLQDSDDSSDDDTPLIKMIKKPPTNDQIKTTVQDLLKEANLEEVTMKQLCQKVYDAYPEFDLTSRKDYIKQTVKSVSRNCSGLTSSLSEI
ncbi:hypothetical protein ACEWY4_020049 [Coilia grayii]|uniref:Protein DEK n=1 Tax=Coilia grayii TaxID=363190 RepID=A0ABD1JEQ0_9TELE